MKKNEASPAKVKPQNQVYQKLDFEQVKKFDILEYKNQNNVIYLTATIVDENYIVLEPLYSVNDQIVINKSEFGKYKFVRKTYDDIKNITDDSTLNLQLNNIKLFFNI